MLVSCTIAGMLAYPTIFLSGNPTAGFTSKPHQIWAAARPVSDRDGQNVDIEMRQLWVHGSYMKALQKDTLQQALTIQRQLIDDDDIADLFSSKDQDEPASWGFHSPLMYWNNSRSTIDADANIVQTVNDQSSSTSSLDVSLRPASVFAGKFFSKDKLVTADALVLTLMNRKGDGMGAKWQDKMHTLDDDACKDCQLYPPHGQISKSWLYEFTLTPVTLQENALLGFAYGLMALYVLVSLRRLKAFHSRVGLVVTAITQMIMSILASFSICRVVLRVNLVAVPQNAYPFILLVIGLENMFRLINAILAYPATMATDLRIANALGDVGPLSIATAVQNLMVLGLLSLVVSPGIVAFCVFAAVATLVDTFFLLTFFVAVLNVDIRRLELQDSISRSKERQKSPPPPHRSWFDALLQGGLPLSTRMAGSVVTTTFILTLNYYFFQKSDQQIAFDRALGYAGPIDDDAIQFDAITSPPMNATLTPGEWMRMQDFDTARGVLRLVDTGAQSFVIRVFAPLIIVLAGADRTGVPTDVPGWRQDLMEITWHHVYPFAIVVVFIITFVWVLMNILLWNEAPEISEEVPERVEDAITIEDIKMTHRLDIVKIAGNQRGDILTAALDRTVSISGIDPATGSRTTEILSEDVVSQMSWPVRHLSIDNTGRWIAIGFGQGSIMLYDRKDESIISRFTAPDSLAVLLFSFVGHGDQLAFVVATASGRLDYQVICNRELHSTQVCDSRLVAATILHGERHDSAIALSDQGYLYMIGLLISLKTELICKLPVDDAKLEFCEISCTYFNTKWMVILRTPDRLMFTDETELIQSIQCNGVGSVIQGTLTECGHCGGPAYTQIGTLEAKAAAGSATIRSLSYQVTHGEQALCIATPSEQCASIAGAVASDHECLNAGYAIPLAASCTLGLRRRVRQSSPPNTTPVRRRRDAVRSEVPGPVANEVWEAYSMDLHGAATVVSFLAGDTNDAEDAALYVTAAGPGIALDDHSAAIAFGNQVKILRITQHKGASGQNGVQRSLSTSRKRIGLRKAQ